jgi:hypothetical protein
MLAKRLMPVDICYLLYRQSIAHRESYVIGRILLGSAVEVRSDASYRYCRLDGARLNLLWCSFSAAEFTQ